MSMRRYVNHWVATSQDRLKNAAFQRYSMVTVLDTY